MQKELLNKATEIFNSADKWNAFLELCYQKDTIKWNYFRMLRQPLLSYFYTNKVNGWICEPWGDTFYDLQWYLESSGNQSLSLAIGWTFQFHLRVNNTAAYNKDKIIQLLKTKYSFLLTGFERIDKQFEIINYAPNTVAMENRNYRFGSPYDSNFDDSNLEKLAWFAGNETQNFADQIIRKVERFTRNEELTEILSQLNAETKIEAISSGL